MDNELARGMKLCWVEAKEDCCVKNIGIIRKGVVSNISYSFGRLEVESIFSPSQKQANDFFENPSSYEAILVKKEKGNERTSDIVGVYPNKDKRILVVKFSDDSVIKIKCCEEDKFDINIGVALAYAYKCFGSKTHFKKEVKRLTKEKKENGK